MRVALLGLVAACWTGDAPAPNVARDKPNAVTARARDRSPTNPVVAAPLGSPAATSAQTLAAELRSNAVADLNAWVTGPVVVLDADAGTFTTLCGAAALIAAHDWGAKLVDPKRPAPHCQVRNAPAAAQASAMCFQAQPDVLLIELEPLDPPRLSRAIVAASLSSLRAKPALFGQLSTQVAAATCP